MAGGINALVGGTAVHQQEAIAKRTPPPNRGIASPPARCKASIATSQIRLGDLPSSASLRSQLRHVRSPALQHAGVRESTPISTSSRKRGWRRASGIPWRHAARNRSRFPIFLLPEKTLWTIFRDGIGLPTPALSAGGSLFGLIARKTAGLSTRGFQGSPFHFSRGFSRMNIRVAIPVS